VVLRMWCHEQQHIVVGGGMGGDVAKGLIHIDEVGSPSHRTQLLHELRCRGRVPLGVREPNECSCITLASRRSASCRNRRPPTPVVEIPELYAPSSPAENAREQQLAVGSRAHTFYELAASPERAEHVFLRELGSDARRCTRGMLTRTPHEQLQILGRSIHPRTRSSSQRGIQASSSCARWVPLP
jgi:hypothetical protein